MQTLFSSYFRATGGVQYLEGGVASGFNHVERDVYEPALLHIKGKRNTRTKQVPVHVSSLNEGDAFILDLGMKLYLVRAWEGGGGGVGVLHGSVVAFVAPSRRRGC